MPIEIDASVPIDNLEGGSQGGRQILERKGLRRAVTPTVTNISAYVSILSSLIMARGGPGGGGGHFAWHVTQSCPEIIHHSLLLLFFPPPLLVLK